jgi:hypothetical protein
VLQNYIDAIDIPPVFVELICFELDELTKEDLVLRLQKRIDDGEVSR